MENGGIIKLELYPEAAPKTFANFLKLVGAVSYTHLNFGAEYYFALEKQLPDTVFLFWRTTPTLMVGKYQNVLEEVNKPYACLLYTSRLFL